MQVVTNRWYAVADSGELGAKPLGLTRFGEALVLWRDGARVCAALDRCPHRGAKLSLGQVNDGCVTCPFHGFAFNGAGTCTKIPAHPTRTISAAMALTTIAARDEHGFLWLWTGPDPAPSSPVPFFDFGALHWAGSAFTVEVKTHYTRAIENQLDYAHLPFVHERTIGRFVKDPAQEMTAEVDGDRVGARGANDEGFELLGPNLWRLRLGQSFQFLAFAPIDATRTRYYGRTYQPRGGPLGWGLGRFSSLTNPFILKEDIAVLESQPAEETRLRMGEVLVPSDRPIIEYRRWRERLRGPFAATRRSPAEEPEAPLASAEQSSTSNQRQAS
jgi:phenylpropionate dioxygenase-like ring-hydroxylating dioxygenase large terminal subunit